MNQDLLLRFYRVFVVVLLVMGWLLQLQPGLIHPFKCQFTFGITYFLKFNLKSVQTLLGVELVVCTLPD